MRSTSLKAITIAAAMASASALAAQAEAAFVFVPVNDDFSTTPYAFAFEGGGFTLSSTGDFSAPTAIQTSGTGQVNTIFGQPTTYFIDRGAVTFGPDQQYAAFPTATPISYSNGGNFFGLRATSGGQTYYGFALTQDSVLRAFGYNTTPGAAVSGAVPEPASWALMVGGFGLLGGALRRRRRTTISFA